MSESTAVSVTVQVTVPPPRCTVGELDVLVNPVSATTHTDPAVASFGSASPPCGADGRWPSIDAEFV
jgi:hypothetical protein